MLKSNLVVHEMLGEQRHFVSGQLVETVAMFGEDLRGNRLQGRRHFGHQS